MDVKVHLHHFSIRYECNRLFVGKFLGQRFIQGKDVGLILIYDSKGMIAGTQMAVS